VFKYKITPLSLQDEIVLDYMESKLMFMYTTLWKNWQLRQLMI